MGQIALGIRSLVIKLFVFFLLAALLAWVLGGTLFPRAERVEFPAVPFAGAEWNVRLSVGGDRPGVARYELMRRSGRNIEAIGGEFAESTEPVVGDHALLIGMRRSDDEGGGWLLRQFRADGTEESTALPDRLTVELVLAGARAGDDDDGDPLGLSDLLRGAPTRPD